MKPPVPLIRQLLDSAVRRAREALPRDYASGHQVPIPLPVSLMGDAVMKVEY